MRGDPATLVREPFSFLCPGENARRSGRSREHANMPPPLWYPHDAKRITDQEQMNKPVITSYRNAPRLSPGMSNLIRDETGEEPSGSSTLVAQDGGFLSHGSGFSIARFCILRITDTGSRVARICRRLRADDCFLPCPEPAVWARAKVLPAP